MSEPLERYTAVVNGSASARYLLLRSVDFAPSGKETVDDLWRTHEEKMGEAKELVRKGSAPALRPSNLLTLKRRIAYDLLKKCCFCEQDCQVDRLAEERGRCGVLRPRVASDFVHHGEEEPLVPSYTVFFAGCNLQCVYCQNYNISTEPGCGQELSAEEMSSKIEKMLKITSKPAGRVYSRGGKIKNVNWVGGDPTPNLHFILDVLDHSGANIVQIWNSNMYMSEKAMRLLDGVVDVYLTDFKYGSDECAEHLSKVKDYMRITTRNHLLAAKQGEVIVRHLMLPGHLECCTIPVIDWLAENMPNALVNIMSQYRPEHRAGEHPELRRTLSKKEYGEALDHARQMNLRLI